MMEDGAGGMEFTESYKLTVLLLPHVLFAVTRTYPLAVPFTVAVMESDVESPAQLDGSAHV